jgi:hypothetical protein
VALLLWLRFLRGQLHYPDGHGIDRIPDCYALRRCDAVKELAGTSYVNFQFHPSMFSRHHDAIRPQRLRDPEGGTRNSLQRTRLTGGASG